MAPLEISHHPADCTNMEMWYLEDVKFCSIIKLPVLGETELMRLNKHLAVINITAFA